MFMVHKEGFVYGKTADERPCKTIENPVRIEQLHQTIYHALGIPPDGISKHNEGLSYYA
jgi:hypothetical protein